MAYVETYAPLNELEAVDADLWIVEGPIERMAYGPTSMPFPTRMVVVRLADGTLWVWSPVAWDEGLDRALSDLGPIAHLVSPNRLHYAHVADWKARHPRARAWAAPGAEARAATQGIATAFDATLGDEAPDAWAGEIDQLRFRGSRFMDEIVFFHRGSRTLVLADLIENFELRKVAPVLHPLLRLAGVADPDGRMPLDLRATFLGRRPAARASFERMRAFAPERVVLAHGRWYRTDGVAELDRAFRWLY